MLETRGRCVRRWPIWSAASKTRTPKEEHMVMFLTLLSGIAWTIVYIDSIRVGFKHKTYAMPIAALGLNIAWEWTYAIRGLADPQLQTWVNLIWALADVAILATFF